MKNGVIYKITSPSGKIYIGQSRDINERLRKYKSCQCKTQTKLYNSLKKYGFEAHNFEIIHEIFDIIDQSELNKYEILYWEQFKNQGFKMLNIKEPGTNGKHSKETKRKISAAHFNMKASEETRTKMSDSAKKRDHTVGTMNIINSSKNGKSNHFSTINEQLARLIKIDLHNKMKTKDIMKKYTISRGIIEGIKFNKSWKNVNI